MNRYVSINSIHINQNALFDVRSIDVPGESNVESLRCVDEIALGRKLIGKGEWSEVGHVVMGASYAGGKYGFAHG